MKRVAFFLAAYSNRFRLQLILLLLLEKFEIFSHLTEKFFNHSFIESRRILGFVYDNGGVAKSVKDGMFVKVKITDVYRNFNLRWNSSDFLVFEQVIIKKEYYPIFEIASAYNLDINTIIDAGGNIGCTTIFLKSYFPKAKIITIEPDLKNFENLRSNIQSNQLTVDCLPFALWHESTKVSLTKEHLDKRDWSIKVSTDGYISTSTVTLAQVFQDLSCDKLDILKMDIEGAETNIFQNDRELPILLSKTLIVAIEIHNDIGKQCIQEQLKNLGFKIFHQHETFFGINLNLIKNTLSIAGNASAIV
jgi:FkbM family methyltransferase